MIKPDFFIDSSSASEISQALTEVPYYGVIGKHTSELELHGTLKTFSFILYSGKSYIRAPENPDFGIAITMKDNGVAIDQIGCNVSHDERVTLFLELCQASSIDAIHDFMFKYGNESLYRGQLD
jgi:hypothetical protein